MMPELSRRWLPLLPILALAILLFYILFINPQRPSLPVSDFILPERLSGRPLQALYQVDTIAAFEGWTPELLRLAGDLWREAGDVTRALPYWHAAAEQNTDDTLLRDIALAELELQDWARASETLNRLIGLVPEDAWAHFQLGLIQAAVYPNVAIEHLEAAARESAYADTAAQLTGVLRRSANDSAALLSVGQMLADRELWAYAELAFTQAASTQPLPEALAYAGLSRDMQGKDGGAWIDQALRLGPDNPTARLVEGLHLRQLGDYDGSLQALIDAVRLDPENPVMYAELGRAYQLSGDLRLARRWLEQAVALSNQDTRFLHMLDALTAEEATLLETLGVAAEATADATAEPVP